METMEPLIQHIHDQPYPCLHLLECLSMGRRYRPDGILPEDLLEDIRSALGDTVLQEEIELLTSFGLLESVDTPDHTGLRLNQEHIPAIDALLEQLRLSLPVKAPQETLSAGGYLSQFVGYLQQNADQVSLLETGKDTLLVQEEDTFFQLLLTLSPFWLPLAAERNKERVIAVGPFACQGWQSLSPYYDWEAFRDCVGMFDLWSNEKMSLCRGSLPVYLDWFHRDRFHQRFSIPAAFCETLHNLGHMRYNDER